MRSRWKWRISVAAPVCIGFLVVDVAFFSANLLKIAEGGWIPLVVGALVFTVMTTWRKGVEVVRRRGAERTEVPDHFLNRLETGQIPRVPGTAVFLTRATKPVPGLMILHVEQFGALPKSVVSLTVDFAEVPRVSAGERLEIEYFAERFYHIQVHYGFMDVPRLSAALAQAVEQHCDIDLDEAIFFGARDDLVSAPGGSTMPRWRLILFSFLHRNALRMVDRFDLAGGRFVEIGRRMEV